MEASKGISVIIPTFNREEYIGEAIQSVISQNYKNDLEIIISDDGSTDRTLDIAKSFGSQVKVLIKPADCVTQGASSARNRGILASTKPFICFLDSDDFYLPNHLNTIIKVFDRDAKIKFVFCRTLEVSEFNGNLVFRNWTRSRIFKNDIRNPVVSRSRIIHTNSLIFKREVFSAVGYFNEVYSNGEDGDMWMRISELFEGDFSDHIGVAYRSHPSSNRLINNPDHKKASISSLIFKNAKHRYYALKLKDSNRIFKINYILIWFEYHSKKISKINFIFKYSILIARYPICFFQKLLEDFYSLQENDNKWKQFALDIFKENKLNQV